MSTAGPNRDPDEQALLALFDETADAASGPVLTKLGARAADVPLAARRRWRAFWFVAPGLAAGLAALLITLGPSLRRPSAPASSATMTESARPGAAASAQAPSPATPSRTPSVAPEPGAELGSLADLDDESSDATGAGLSFAPLYAPEPDKDVDAWLYATQTVLQDEIR